jgi:hypothetical protein
MRIIKLFTGEDVIVDDEDYEYLSGFKWSLHKSPSHPIGYAHMITKTTKKRWYMHRLIMVHHGKDISGKLVDHWDLNTLNNQKVNLRPASHCQSQYNKGIQANNRSGYKGVCRAKGRKAWTVQINKDGKKFFRKTFKSFPDAAQVSLLVRFLAHGEFANFG